MSNVHDRSRRRHSSFTHTALTVVEELEADDVAARANYDPSFVTNWISSYTSRLPDRITYFARSELQAEEANKLD